MTPKVAITCAVTGSSPTPALSAAVPVTPRQIAESAADAVSAGASIVHVHVRDPATGGASSKLEHYREVCDRLSAWAPDAIINLTTGPGGRFVPGPDDPLLPGLGTTLRRPELRVAHIAELRPEMCSLDVATMNARGRVMMNTPEHLERMAQVIRAAGTIPELEVFDLGHIRLASYLLEQEVLSAPAVFQLCMGVPWGAPATPKALAAMVDALPPQAIWFAFGIGSDQFSIAAQAVLLGGHVRVGLEDNLYVERGVLASSNAALVEKATRLIKLLGASVATPEETRSILGTQARS